MALGEVFGLEASAIFSLALFKPDDSPSVKALILVDALPLAMEQGDTRGRARTDEGEVGGPMGRDEVDDRERARWGFNKAS